MTTASHQAKVSLSHTGGTNLILATLLSFDGSGKSIELPNDQIRSMSEAWFCCYKRLSHSL